jgi:hypothetical protein
LSVDTTATRVVLGDVRGGPDEATLREDNWWVQPVVTVAVLTAFVIYSTWAAFQNKNYYVGALFNRNLVSPLYSPCIMNSCVPGSNFAGLHIAAPTWLSPALVILIVPLGFRLTCYYYRRSYYRAFWWSPPACAVADAHPTYSGETRLPLVLQNIHRYFFALALVFNVILTYDAVKSYDLPGLGVGVTLGSLVLTLNAALLWGYSLSCHSCRHLCGGQVRSFRAHPIRRRLWKFVTPFNERHMYFAWASLVMVGFTDVYVRLVASGAITDYRLF